MSFRGLSARELIIACGFTVQVTCSTCQGYGKDLQNGVRCLSCVGSGSVAHNYKPFDFPYNNSCPVYGVGRPNPCKSHYWIRDNKVVWC